MANTEKLDTHHKALTLNLDPSTFGSFAEIGAGQEVARWFLVVGGASGTVAKTISAYDKEVSDDLYGTGSRYVSKQRLQAMLDREWSELQTQLGQQEAVGILGVNLIFAAFYQLETKESFLEGLAEDVVRGRVEIDFVECRGPAFSGWDHQHLLAHLVQAGFAEAVRFSGNGAAGPPSEVLHNKAVVLAPGYFGHVDAAHARIHMQILAAGIHELRLELGDALSAPIGIFCLTAASVDPAASTPEIPGLLRRINALLARGGDVLLFRERELYAMTGLVNRYTKAPLRFVAGLSLLIRAFDDPYGNLEGSRFEGLARLFAQNVRIYAYPMAATDLHEWIKSSSVRGWEWSETNAWVSANQLRHTPPLGHLYAYLLASNFLVAMETPAALTATTQPGALR
jgi:hypothetical protein